MINLNLAIKPKPLVRWPFVLKVVVVVVLLGAGALAAYSGLSRLGRLRVEQAAMRQLLSAYREQGKDLPAVQQAVAELELFLAGAEQLGRNQRFSQADVLEAVWVRPEGLRLTRATFAGSELTLSGDAPTFAAANQYLLALRALPRVEAVDEVAATRWAHGFTTFTYRVRLREEVAQP